MTTSYAKRERAKEDPELQKAYKFLDTPLQVIVENAWPQSSLTVELTIKLGLHGNADISDLFWHRETWYLEPRRSWLNDDERAAVIATRRELWGKFGSDHKCNPIELLNKRRAAQGFQPYVHHTSDAGTKPPMAMMHKVYPGT